MNMIEQARNDLEFTLEDQENGFALSFEFKNESDEWIEIPVKTTDISYFMDLGTGTAIDARTAEITASMATLAVKNIPTVTKNTIIRTLANGEYFLYKIARIHPDRLLNVYLFGLESVAAEPTE